MIFGFHFSPYQGAAPPGPVAVLRGSRRLPPLCTAWARHVYLSGVMLDSFYVWVFTVPLGEGNTFINRRT